MLDNRLLSPSLRIKWKMMNKATKNRKMSSLKNFTNGHIIYEDLWKKDFMTGAKMLSVNGKKHALTHGCNHKSEKKTN